MATQSKAYARTSASLSRMRLNHTPPVHVQNKSFMRVKGRVQLSTYRIRSFQFQVAEEFLAHVKSLPLAYDKGIYFAFLEDYGTHYTRSGKSGGEYELIYVLNQDTVKSKSVFTLQSQSALLLWYLWQMMMCVSFADITQRQLQKCLKAGINANIGLTGSGASLGGNVDRDGCDTVTTGNTGQSFFCLCWVASWQRATHCDPLSHSGYWRKGSDWQRDDVCQRRHPGKCCCYEGPTEQGRSDGHPHIPELGSEHQ